MRATRVLLADPDNPDPAVVAEAAAILRDGGLVAFATETVYGLGAIATDPAAVAGIFEAKGRPATNPLIVHAADLDMARACAAEWPRSAELLAEAFWPGPLTIVLAKRPVIADNATAGGPTVGVRVPGLVVARRLIESTGLPIAAPSANRSNGISPTTAGHVRDDLEGRIDAILDSGPATVGLESTVVDLCGGQPKILRPGPITARMLTLALHGWPVLEGGGGEAGRSPGQGAVHYAPRTPTYRVERADWSTERPHPEGAIVLRFEMHSLMGRWSLPSPEVASGRLYATLRSADEARPTMILVVMPPDEPEWRAVRDRLTRASRPWDGADSA